MTAPSRPALSERDWQQQVIALAKLRGWWIFHDHDSRRNTAGLPDLLLLRDRLVVAELKTTRGRLSTAQVDVGCRFHAAGIESYIWRPSDLPEIQRVLAPADPTEPAGVLRARLEAVAALPDVPGAGVVDAGLDMGESPAAFVAGWQAALAASRRAARGETA